MSHEVAQLMLEEMFVFYWPLFMCVLYYSGLMAWACDLETRKWHRYINDMHGRNRHADIKKRK